MSKRRLDCHKALHQGGHSLIEIMTVVGILGVLCAVALPPAPPQ
jgi:prepilin-type N-terminal cleavage/methylation domain-containing protein